MSTETVTISHMGSEGDGVVRGGAGPVFVPFTLPGETVAIARVKNQGMPMSWVDTSAERVTPPCRHFGPDAENGACGGCSLQHWADLPYQTWKRNLVVEALRGKGIETEIRDLVACSPGERRRVAFTGRKTEKGVILGFSQAASHHLIDLRECPISEPAIVARLPEIRQIAASLATNADPFKVTVLHTLSGLDLAFGDIKKLDDARRQAMIDVVLPMKGIARVSLNGEILIEPHKPMLDFSGVSVVVPPGAFVQATERAENVMSDLAIAHVGKAKRVADLFSGCGTFALRLARKSAVHAVEFEAPALAALDLAARKAQGLKPVSFERRDLFRRPMQPMDLKQVEAVVFDPPRAGAEAQAHELARSKVARIAAISCNPVTLARDLAILIEGGYKLKSVTPIDQFLWSSHVEAVALLER